MSCSCPENCQNQTVRNGKPDGPIFSDLPNLVINRHGERGLYSDLYLQGGFEARGALYCDDGPNHRDPPGRHVLGVGLQVALYGHVYKHLKYHPPCNDYYHE